MRSAFLLEEKQAKNVAAKQVLNKKREMDRSSSLFACFARAQKKNEALTALPSAAASSSISRCFAAAFFAAASGSLAHSS